MSNDLPVNDQVVDQAKNKKEEITQLSSEGPPIEIGSVEKENLFENLEKETTPEVSKPLVDKKEMKAQKEADVKEKSSEEVGKVKNVVDKRTHNEQTTQISDARQSLTKKADDKEEDFIDHVEEVHSIK